VRAAAEIGHFRQVRLRSVVLASGVTPRGLGGEARERRRPENGQNGVLDISC
jgi:hypothetical protein